MKIKTIGGRKVLAEPSNSTATEIRHEYNLLVPEIQQVRALFRSERRKISPGELKKLYRRKVLGKWADDEEWNMMIEEYGKPNGRSAQPKSIAKAILRRKTGLREKTIDTYVKPSR